MHIQGPCYRTPTRIPVEGGWSWREGVQVFHLLVSFLVFVSIVVPRGLPATLQISAKAFVDTLTYHHHSLLCTLPRSYALQRSARASSTPPHPLISPSTVQKSVRAFVHTPQHRIGGTLRHEYCRARTWYAETCGPKKCVPMLVFSPHLMRRGRNARVTWYFPRTFGERRG